MALALVVLTAASALAVGGVAWEVNRREEAVCDAIADNRRGLQALIDVVLEEEREGGGDGSVNLEAIPEFRAVDPEVQALVRVLVNGRPDDGQDDETPDILDRLRTFRKTLDVEGC